MTNINFQIFCHYLAIYLPTATYSICFKVKFFHLDMRTYQKTAQKDEQELLAKLLPMRILRMKQKSFWTINTNAVTYQLIGIGRLPHGIDVVEEWSNPAELDASILDSNDLFECYDKENQIGKYRITTRCFTGGTDKFNRIRVYWDNVLDMAKLNCYDIEKLGVTTQIIKKKKTYLSTEESIQSINVKFYYKFHFI